VRTRLYVAGALGGLALLAVAVVIILAFGRHDPSPPSLRDNPNPAIPGEILYINQDSCFVRAQASGAASERLACAPQYFAPGNLYWIDADTAGFLVYGPSTATLQEIDLRTGEITPTGRPVDPSQQKQPPFGAYGGAYAPDGTFAFFEEDGVLVLIEGGARAEITDFDVPRYRQPQVVLWSPDSQWIVAQYHGPHADGPELWIISRDGQTAGTLTNDVAWGNAVTWRIEGVGVQPELPSYQR
jgi:hypothetical protein